MWRPIFLLVLSSLILTACANRQLKKSPVNQVDEVSELAQLMTGKFSSTEQAAKDSLFYDISLVMHPIWETDQSAKWLYVEQAVAKAMKKPYRQRVYRISKMDDGRIESRVYTLANPKKYIHAWENPTIFNNINADSLMIREGCAVFLQKNGEGCYSGSTKEKDCQSSLRGATYATSEVTVCEGVVLSWDQGWDKTDKQVWGAETGGYVFKKVMDKK